MSSRSHSADWLLLWSVAAALSCSALAAPLAERLAAPLAERLAAPLAARQPTAAIAGDQPGTSPQKFSLGVLRGDGLLVPFAAFDGHEWSYPWPDDTRHLAVPITLNDIPAKWWGPVGPRARWTVWLLDGIQKPVAVTGVRRVQVFCGTRLALTTDYRGEPFDPADPTVPKDGLALAGAAELLPIESVRSDAPDARAMVTAMTDAFNAAEADAATAFTKWTHPLDAEARARLPIDLEAFYRAPLPASSGASGRPSPSAATVAYVEAVRRFPPAPADDGCGLITYVFGWATSRPGKPPVFEVRGRVTYCDRANVPFMLPFGRLEVRGEHYWVYQMSSWRDEVYEVALVKPAQVAAAVSYNGGFCAREQ